MVFTSLDLSTAVFPVGGAVYDAGAITSASPGDSIEFLFSGLALDPGTYYQFQFDVDAYDETLTLPYVYFTATNAGETSTYYPQLGETFDPTESGAPCTLTVNVGPDLDDWNSATGAGYNHPWFYFDADVRIVGVRYQKMRLTAQTDWLDDALPVWVARQSYPADAREVVISADAGFPGPATVDACWDGTGTIGVTVTDYSVFEGGADVSSLFGSPGVFGCLWQQSWLTMKRTGADPTVSVGQLPASPNEPVFVEWEPSSVPDDVRLHLLLHTTAYTEGYNWFIKKVDLVPGDPAYHPGFVSGASMAGQPTLVGPISPATLDSTITLDKDDLATFGIGPTGDVQFALAPVDEWTQAQSWAYGTPPSPASQRVSTSFESGYTLRYKAQYLVPFGGVPERRIFPRQATDRQIWPPPATFQAGRGIGPNTPV